MKKSHSKRSRKISVASVAPSVQSVILMGILNLTPDSFSDGDNYRTTTSAVNAALRMIAEGASIIDIGGESSRPGAKPVSQALELKRVIPVITALRKKTKALISIDTYKPAVAAAALTAGANWVNDIRGLRDPEIRRVVAEWQCPVVLMHMLGEPQTMQQKPHYTNVVDDIIKYFQHQIKLAKHDGIKPNNIILDPGIGFGKTVQHNLDIIKHLGEFKKAFPNNHILIGASRKSFIGKLTEAEVADRLPGTLAAHLIAVQNGATILRVHDVAAHTQALTLFRLTNRRTTH